MSMLSRWIGLDRGGSDRPQAFEALEPRQLLSISATVIDTTVRPTEWLLVVRYQSDAAVDLSTIGNGDIRVTASANPGGAPPFSYEQPGTLWMQPIPQQDGSVLAVYRVGANGGAWDYSDNAWYRIRMNPNEVRDTSGSYAPEKIIGQNFLWFTNPKAEITQAVVGGSGWQVTVLYSDDNGIDESSLASGNIEVRKGAFTAIGTFNYKLAVAGGIKAYYTLKIAQVSASWLNNGSYDVWMRSAQVFDTAGYSLPAFKLGTYSYSTSNPGAQLVSQNMTASAWTVTVRYSDDAGINVSSIGNGDIRAKLNSSSFLPSTLVGSPTVDTDGTVLATYQILGSFSAAGGVYDLTMTGTQVYDTAGNSVTGGEFIRKENTARGLPSGTTLSNTRVNANTWDVTVRFTDDVSLLAASIATGSVNVTTTRGFYAMPILVSATQESSGSWTATYRMTTTASSFAPGRYYLRTQNLGVFDNAGHGSPDMELLAFTL